MAKAEHNQPEADRADGCAHPRDVYELVGHHQAEMRFADMLDAGTLHHAWLVSGPEGVGKASLAYRMIRRVLGGKPLTKGGLDVPASDPVARRVQSLGHGDFLLIRRPWDDKAKKLRAEIPISEARRIGQFFSRKASEGGWRVCLVDTMDDMNRNAANSVLKTLEEPPKKALLILLSKTPGRLLPTIRSRCLSLALRPVEDKPLKDWLLTQTGSVDTEHIEAAIQLAGGAPGKALSFVKNADDVLRPLGRFVSAFPRPNTSDMHTITEGLAAANKSIAYNLFWDALNTSLHAQAHYAATGEWEGAYGPISKERPTEAWLDLIQTLEVLRQSQKALNMNKKQALLQAMLDIAGA